MSLVRPELLALLQRWREVLAGAGIVLLGGWIATFGGWFFAGLGGLVAAAGVALAINGARRMRFDAHGQGPGMVQVVEGQIAYFGPETGGFLGLTELEELQLADRPVGRCWLLRRSDGSVLEVPLEARGAAALYDLFATLPGIDMAHVSAAAARGAGRAQVLWRRRPRAALT